ncbi:UvrD-helicase domain-containing protein [Streptacidiphilus neutrinimicus]|uniref:UvrD-helicase domain-containing protein n=1 Tax=Streptacidiphilus neutrinimicus TaxID=105420 RepID=UPI0005AAAC9E|nr:UvrD-helicase domain-containing protein [Streptacidiphilus neutrinimicus]
MPIAPTAEQQAAREVFAGGRDLALVAGAGTGKTSTLILMGQSTRKRGLYVAFNKAIAEDAKKRFGRNVECRTAHSLAFQSVGRRYGERINRSARLPSWQTARRLGIHRDLPVNSSRITVQHQARLVTGMVRRFCYTTDRQLMARHLEHVNGLDAAGQDFLARELLPYAAKAWEDLQDPAGELRFEHDHYMKMWALSAPVLRADFVLLDEAQDTNPVLEEVFLSQSAQRVCVGDPAQQIYAWRAAKDVMTGFPAEHLELTQSFRFGPAIAAAANRWLGHAESAMRLAGCGPMGSKIGPAARVDAVLCRSNADAMREVIGFLDDGVPVALAGGGAALERIALAAMELRAGQRTSHPELFLFSSWAEVQEYVEQDSAGQDLKAIVQLVDAHGPEEILAAVQRLAPEEHAAVTVSTAHKAKGREWDTVRIAGGFEAPPVDEDGAQLPLTLPEARLAYVAVTRARLHLDTSGLDWLEGYEQALADGPGSGGHRLIEFSLTRQLKHRGSPISRFLAEHLPDARSVVGDYAARLPRLPYPVQPVDVAHPDFAALGHAVDYLLRLSLGRELGGAVNLGVASLHPRHELPGAPAMPVRAALHSAGVQLLDLVGRHLESGGTYLDDEALSRLCFVAAFFEDVYRCGRLRRYSLLARADEHITVQRLTEAAPRYVVDDLAAQMRLAEEPFRKLRALPEKERVCGPVFAGSADIGGADADFILGGLLLDCKATTRPRQLGEAEVYQLAGYLLLDYDDRYRIDQVGLYLSRQGHLITWPVGEFLRQLGTATKLPVLRRQLREFLHAEAITSRSEPGP